MPLFKKSVKSKVYIALNVDNNLMIGGMAAIDNAMRALKIKGLVLIIVERLQDYLSYEINLSEVKKKAWLGQTHLIKNTEKKFGKLVQFIWSHKTPGTPTFLIVRPMVKREKISMEDKQDYWLSIGTLLYLVKHSCPNLANMMRELLKANDGANPAA